MFKENIVRSRMSKIKLNMASSREIWLLLREDNMLRESLESAMVICQVARWQKKQEIQVNI